MFLSQIILVIIPSLRLFQSLLYILNHPPSSFQEKETIPYINSNLLSQYPILTKLQQNQQSMQLKITLPKYNQFKQIDNRWSQIKMLSSFTPRCSFAFCSQGEIGYLHGGYNSDQGTLGDMYMARFNDPDDRSWYQLEQKGKQIPGRLKNHTLTPFLCYLLCIGGQKFQTQDNGEIFKYNLKTKTWSKLQLIPQDEIPLKEYKNLLKRDSHCCFIFKNKLYIFGGYLSEIGEYSNHTIIINLQRLQSQKQASIKLLKYEGSGNIPPPRSSFASCTLQGYAYIFGGTNQLQVLDDLWRFNLETEKWQELKPSSHQKSSWPEKRKGAALVAHQQSESLILFGGMQQVTKQLNDLCIYLTHQNKWVKVHSNTNNIYDPSPTLKCQTETSPTILNHKFKKQIKDNFKLDILNVECNDTNQKDKHNLSPNTIQPRNKSSNSTHLKGNKFVHSFSNKKRPSFKTQTPFHKKGIKTDPFLSTSFTDTHKQSHKQGKMSVVQQKKYRQFLVRKKKLLSEICSQYKSQNFKRPYSPTSQCLNYTLNKLGQQQKFHESKNPQFILPKVIFDDKKSQVIGKKPCARDGHAAFGYDQNMYIIGGDRHTVSFNDTHLLRMDKAIESLNYYT